MKNKKIILSLKIIVSLWIVYHLAMILIIPNRSSMANESFRPYFISYAQSLSMNSAWAYYAPNPITYFYFQYEVIKKQSVETYRWPPSRTESKRILFNHKRFITHSLFFWKIGAEHIRKHFLPYLCRLHPLAEEIAIKIIYENRSHFKKAKIMHVPFWPTSNKNMQALTITSSRCRRAKKSKMREINSTEDTEEWNETNDTYDEESF